MPPLNHGLVHRPLRGGIAIYNPCVGEQGTLGFIGTSDGNDRWLVSCYHVLCNKNLDVAPGNEPIYQPVDDDAYLIAHTANSRQDLRLDCAAACVLPNITCSSEVLHLPRINGARRPTIGMRVIKSGCTTGVTEGVITAVNEAQIEIQLVETYPQASELSDIGDSGALWVSRDDVCAVGLHLAGSAYGVPLAKATPLELVLESLRLKPLFG